MQKDYPKSVNRIIEFVQDNKLWYSLTWNHEAGGCADAAHKRNRLGGENGIPLCDELKSSIGYYISSNEKKYMLIHCRGNQMIDDDKIKSLLGSEYVRLPKEDLQSEFNCEYGLVNPFFFGSNFPDIEQLFDKSVLDDFFPPYTLMTNAGDKNWGIEFRSRELVDVLKTKRVAEFITDESKIKIRKHKIGILTGNSPESGIFLWQKINDKIREKLGDDFLGDLSLPAVIVESMPSMGLSMELDNRDSETWQVVENGITALCKNGATIIGVACNTTQYFSKEIRAICNKHDAEFFSMYGAVNTFLISEKIKHFDFLGIKFVTDFTKWSDFKKLKEDFKVEIPSAKNLDEINNIAFIVKQKGVVTPKGINKLRDQIRNHTKTKNIIIALTEISVLLASNKPPKGDDRLYIDTLTLLANKMADRYLNDHSKELLKTQKQIAEMQEEDQ
jgi:aspartate/glutamate racemase/prolyl-tRNA editing enzyme YbaK/EbsC (Cys-tRNA(Pro) deacylase)